MTARKNVHFNATKLLLGVSIILIIFIISLLFYISINREVHTVEVRFSVGQITGIDLDTSALVFGRIRPGGSATRAILVNNTHDVPVEIDIFMSKSLEGYITAEPPKQLAAHQSIRLPVTLAVPRDAQEGNYSGTLVVVIRK